MVLNSQREREGGSNLTQVYWNKCVVKPSSKRQPPRDPKKLRSLVLSNNPENNIPRKRQLTLTSKSWLNLIPDSPDTRRSLSPHVVVPVAARQIGFQGPRLSSSRGRLVRGSRGSVFALPLRLCLSNRSRALAGTRANSTGAACKIGARPAHGCFRAHRRASFKQGGGCLPRNHIAIGEPSGVLRGCDYFFACCIVWLANIGTYSREELSRGFHRVTWPRHWERGVGKCRCIQRLTNDENNRLSRVLWILG